MRLLLTGDKEPRLFYGYVVVLIGFFALTTMHGLLYSFGVFVKQISAEFGWTRAVISGAYSMGICVSGILAMVTGKLNDRFGPRILITVGSGFLGIGYILMSEISHSWQPYLFWGLLVGAGISTGFVPLTSTVARWFVKRGGMMSGVLASGAGLGSIIVPLMASWLILAYGWRTSFLIMGIISLTLLIFGAQFLKRDPLVVGQLPYEEDKVRKQGMTFDSEGLSLMNAMHTKELWILCTIYFFLYGFTIAIMMHIVPHALDLGVPPMTSAGILASIGGLSIAGRISIGSVSDRIGIKSSLILCFILLSASLLWLQLATEVWMFYIYGSVFGFCTGGLVALESPVIAEFFGLKEHGLILGLIILSGCTGGAISSLAAGIMFDITCSYFKIFLIYALLATTSLAFVSILEPRRK